MHENINLVVQSGEVLSVSPVHAGFDVQSFVLRRGPDDILHCRVREELLTSQKITLCDGKRVSFYGKLFSRKNGPGLYCMVSHFFSAIDAD